METKILTDEEIIASLPVVTGRRGSDRSRPAMMHAWLKANGPARVKAIAASQGIDRSTCNTHLTAHPELFRVVEQIVTSVKGRRTNVWAAI